MDQRVIDLYNVYIHGDMPRRDFLQRLAGIAGGVAAASSLLPLIECNYARAAEVAHRIMRISTRVMQATRARAVPCAHTSRARSGQRERCPAFRSSTKIAASTRTSKTSRAAPPLRAIVAVAPDGLSVAGGAPRRSGKGARSLRGDGPGGHRFRRDRRPSDSWQDARSAPARSARSVSATAAASRCNARPAARDHGAAVAFYGAALPRRQGREGEGGAHDALRRQGRSHRRRHHDFRAALDAHEIAYSLNMYPGTQHGFHNDSSEARYDAAAAKLAWTRTIAFFDHYLKV